MKHDIKRMLELAAKAIGKEITWRGEYPTIAYSDEEVEKLDGIEGYRWNPASYDGDSRKLEVTLGLLVDVDWDSRTATAVVPDRAEMARNIVHIVNIPEGSDGMAETRLAVLMAAAAVGEAMP